MAYGDATNMGYAVFMTVKNELGYHPGFGARVILEWRISSWEKTTYGTFPHFYPVAIAETTEAYGYPVWSTYPHSFDVFTIVFSGSATMTFKSGEEKTLSRPERTVLCS